jgi:hypothetical protein
MIENNKRLVVAEDDWQKYLTDYWQAEVKSYQEEDLTVAQAEEHFYWSGDVNTYIEEATRDATPVSWHFVASYNPTRDFELLRANIKTYWEWVLVAPEDRLPRSVKVADIDAYFIQPLHWLGTLSSPIRDPLNAAKMFELVYGTEFKPENAYPEAFGKDNWQPIIRCNATEMFIRLMGGIDSYLFNSESNMLDKQLTAHVDYWLSTIPYIDDLRIFDTKLYKKERIGLDNERLFSLQKSVRRFIASFEGIDVWDEGGVHISDAEFYAEVKDKMSKAQWPDEYHRLVEFIKQHGAASIKMSE